VNIAFYEEPTPLDYPERGAVQRFGLFSPELLDMPFDPSDRYFAVTERVHRYGKTRKLLKKPRIEVLPGARPGTLAWLDWHMIGPRVVYIDFMTVRSDWRGSGAGRRLVEAFYEHVVVPRADVVDWGKIMDDRAVHLWRHMEKLYPSIRHYGKIR
jgi:GNAT superfamily N-acetyltransferase